MCKEIDKNLSFWLGIIAIIAAGVLIGLGVGMMFCKGLEGLLTGSGVSLLIIGIFLLKTYRCLDIYE